jgi:pyruvate, water dikinase
MRVSPVNRTLTSGWSALTRLSKRSEPAGRVCSTLARSLIAPSEFATTPTCLCRQKMVDAAAAGVAMTLDPINGDRTKIVIDSAFGLGEPVVSGEITPDNFVVEKVLLEITRRRIVEKDHELVADHVARRTIDRVIEPERRTQPSLSDQEVIAVARLAKQLEKSMGGPQDVEWAIDRDLPAGENLVALQSRPETVWSQQIGRTPQKIYATGIEGVLGTLLSPLKVKQ